jgi:hypothetical protein
MNIEDTSDNDDDVNDDDNDDDNDDSSFCDDEIEFRPNPPILRDRGDN